VPISVSLVFCIPIGVLFYFEARWLIRYAVGRFEHRERKAARFCGAFGVSLIPLIYCFGLIQEAYPGTLGKTIAYGLLAAATWVFFGLITNTLKERK
jgi:hypothetical protein